MAKTTRDQNQPFQQHNRYRSDKYAELVYLNILLYHSVVVVQKRNYGWSNLKHQ